MDPFKFNTALLNYLWEKRNRELLPAKKSGLRNQKFLLFYNLFAREQKKSYTFNDLRAFDQGPVYYQEYLYASQPKFEGVKTVFINQLNSHTMLGDYFDFNSAKASYTILISTTEKQLSEITHKFDFWINNHNKSIRGTDSIKEEDITSKDEMLIKWLFDFSVDLYDNYNFLETKNNKFFIRSKYEQYIKLPEYKKVISKKYKYNPVVIDIDQDGHIILD